MSDKINSAFAQQVRVADAVTSHDLRTERAVQKGEKLRRLEQELTDDLLDGRVRVHQEVVE